MTGTLYDGFDLVRSSAGTKTIEELAQPVPPTRRCTGTAGPDGLPCTAEPKD